MSQTTETPQPTNAELVAQVVGAVTAVQDAEAVLVEGAKNLADHIADPNAHGRDVAACIAQAVADHDGNEGAHNGTFVKAGDARLTDARAPKPHKDSHKTGGADALAPADAASMLLLKEQLGDVLKTLTPREEKVLSLRFGLEDGHPRTLEEVGKEFNVTRERIRQIEAKALRKLRHPSRSKKLKDFLD